MNRRKALQLAGLSGLGGVALAVGAAAPAVATDGVLFHPITPYRSYDSRPDRLESGDLFDIDLITDEYSDLRLPTNTLAVTYNLTIAETLAQGYLALFPANTDWPGSSSINWWQNGLLLANGGTVSIAISPVTGRAGSVTVYCGGGGRTSFIIDVTGYYL
jgi:hypothetical protein